MINIYISFKDKIFGFFNKDMYKLCKRNTILILNLKLKTQILYFIYLIWVLKIL